MHPRSLLPGRKESSSTLVEPSNNQGGTTEPPEKQHEFVRFEPLDPEDPYNWSSVGRLVSFLDLSPRSLVFGKDYGSFPRLMLISRGGKCTFS